MQFIDTHTHLYLSEFDGDRDETINRAIGRGIIKMLMPNIDYKSVDQMLAVHERYPGICYPMLGLHPTSVREDFASQLRRLELLFPDNKYIAVGEIGIDLYWDKTRLAEQVAAFRRQLEFAIEKGLPAVIHSRDSFHAVFNVLDEFSGTGLKGVFHAFSGSMEDAERAVSMDFKLGIGGVVTFKNSGLDKIIKAIGPDNLIYETDSPYLAPVPYRGKRNESSYIYIINQKVAEILEMSEEETASVLYNNSIRLFGL